MGHSKWRTTSRQVSLAERLGIRPDRMTRQELSAAIDRRLAERRAEDARRQEQDEADRASGRWKDRWARQFVGCVVLWHGGGSSSTPFVVGDVETTGAWMLVGYDLRHDVLRRLRVYCGPKQQAFDVVERPPPGWRHEALAYQLAWSYGFVERRTAEHRKQVLALLRQSLPALARRDALEYGEFWDEEEILRVLKEDASSDG